MDWLLHNPIAEIFGPYSDSTVERLNLAPAGMADLCQVAHAEIAAFARSLNHKRLGAVKELLPLTTRALRPRFETLFLEHAARYRPPGFRSISTTHSRSRDFSLDGAISLNRPRWLASVFMRRHRSRSVTRTGCFAFGSCATAPGR